MSPSVMCPVQLLLNYQRWRRESPEISSCLSPSSVLGLLNTSYHAVLPQRDCTGSRVLIYRIGQYAWVWIIERACRSSPNDINMSYDKQAKPPWSVSSVI